MGLFSVGDLVWAKTKNSPPWPARVTEPPSHIKKIKQTKTKNCVYFFGTRNYAWVPTTHLEPYGAWDPRKPYPKRKMFSIAVEEARVYEAEHFEKENITNESSPAMQVERQPENEPESESESESESEPEYDPPPPEAIVPQQLPDQEDALKTVVKEEQEIEERIGFIGMGTMGSEIVKIFLQNSKRVYFWNRTLGRCDYFYKEIGATFCANPRRLARRSTVLFVCVSDDEAVYEVNKRIFGTNLRGKVYVQLSSVTIKCSVETSQEVNRRCGTYLEAQMIGNTSSLFYKNLILPVAGCERSYYRVSDLLSLFSSKLYVGDLGNAVTLRLLMNMFMATASAALAEGISLLKKCSIKVDVLYSILNTEGMKLTSLSLLERCASMAGGPKFIYSFQSASRVQDALKEILEMFENQSQSSLVSSMTKEALKKVCEQNNEDEDIILGLTSSN